MYASLAAGALVTGMVFMNQFFSEEEEEAEEIFSNLKSRKELLEDLTNELKAELRENHKSHVIPTDKDGWFTEKFMIDVHSILYKFKVYGKDIISYCNFRERVKIMAEAEEAKTEGLDAEYTKLMKSYDEKLKGEEQGVNEFVMTMQDIVFDYFNLIVKEYYLNIDKH